MFDKEFVDAYFDHGVDVTNRRVFINDITEETISVAVKALYLMETESEDTPCEIFINSGGGDIYECLAFYDIMNTVCCPVHTFGYGKIMSASILLLAAGTPGSRWCAPNTSFMTHDYSVDLSGKGAALRVDMKHNEELNKRWLQLLANHSKRDFRFWKNKSEKVGDSYFDVDEALEFGLADHIWSEK